MKNQINHYTSSIIQMRSVWQLQSQHKQDYQQFLYAQLENIRKIKCGTPLKMQMLQGMICLLREKTECEKIKARENMSTSFSQNLSNCTAFEQEIEDLEQKILHKRVIKFQINQQIQSVEEDLFELEKTVDTKVQYDQFLRKKIQSTMKKVQRVQRVQKHDQKQEPKSYVNKSLTAVTGLFKGWLK